MKVILLFIILFGYSTSYGVDTSEQALTEEEFSIKARNRDYPGGVDEEDLRVQESLPIARQKVDLRSLQKRVYQTMFKKEEEERSSASTEDE